MEHDDGRARPLLSRAGGGSGGGYGSGGVRVRDAVATLSRALVAVRSMYWLIGVEAAVFVPFFSVFMAKCGLNGSHVGVVMAARNVGAILSSPAWGSALDAAARRRRRTPLFALALFCRLVPASALLFTFWGCSASGGGAEATGSGVAATMARVLDAMGGVYPALIIFAATAAVFATPVQIGLDATTLHLLGDNRHAYGRSRAFLSVGMGMGSLAAGLVFDRYSDRAVWAGLVALMCFDSCVGVAMSQMAAGRLNAERGSGNTRTVVKPTAGAVEDEVTNVEVSGRGAKARLASGALAQACQLLRNWHMLFFLGISVVLGIGNATYDVYIVLFMEQLAAPGWMVGAAVAVGCASNVVLFFLAPTLLRLVGSRAMLAAAMAAFVARVYLYSLADEPWQVLPVQLLHGINFSVMWTGGVDFVRQLATLDSVATAQSLFQGSFFGVGGLVGLLVGGWLYDHVGPKHMFLLKGAATAVALLAFLVLEVVPHAVASAQQRRRRQGLATQPLAAAAEH